MKSYTVIINNDVFFIRHDSVIEAIESGINQYNNLYGVGKITFICAKPEIITPE